MNYYLKDHLGSIVGVADGQGNLLQELNYDAWGKRRNANTWAHSNTLPAPITTYGFTGHEHWDNFALSNMKGRLYDPVVGRFLSPDPVVQKHEYGPNYNPYSYCPNKPLKYIDPSGYSWGGGDPPNNGSQSLGFFDWIGMVLMNVNFPGLNYSTPSIDFGGYQSTGNTAVLESGMNNAAAGSSYGFNFTYDFGFGSNGGFPGYNPAYEALAIPFISNEVYNQVQVDAKQDYGRDQNSLVYRNFVYRNNDQAGGDALDPSTVGQNLPLIGGRSTYAGGDNPMTYSGKYTYLYVPTMLTDYPAIGHDRRYDNLGVNGVSGLLFDTRAIGADWRFVGEQLSLMRLPLDYGTRINAGILGFGLGGAALPKTILQLAKPIGFGEMMMWYHISNYGVTNKPGD